MAEVTMRELRNKGGEVIDRVEAGETFTVTRSGKPVAELRPLPVKPTNLTAYLERRRGMPSTDPEQLRREIDALIDPRLFHDES